MYNNLSSKTLKTYALCLVFTFFSQNVISQTEWLDNFNDGDLRDSVPWMGDTNVFMVNAQLELQLNAPPSASKKTLFTQSTAAWNTEWSFQMKMLFNPSSSNFAEVILLSDTMDLSFANAYVFRLGGTSEDRLHLIRMDEGVATEVWQSQKDLLDSTIIQGQFSIKRTPASYFKFYWNGIVLDSVHDDQHLVSRYFGLQCTYTSTRSTKFYFDSILVSGALYVDSLAPSIEDFDLHTQQTATIHWNEEIDSSSLFQSMKMDQTTIDRFEHHQNQTRIYFPPLKAGDHILSIEGALDHYNNPLDTAFYFSYDPLEYGSILLNEIMMDPSPPVHLPEYDFIEILNNKGTALQTKGLQLKVGDRSFDFPEYLWPADSLIVLTSVEGSSYFHTGHIIPMNWPINFIPNAGDSVILYDRYKNPIQSWWIHDELYQNPLKKDGGWSLTRTDAYPSCETDALWQASVHPQGGSPGLYNEGDFHPSQDDLWITKVIYQDAKNITIHFNQSIDSVYILATEQLAQSHFQHAQLNIQFDHDLRPNPTEIFIYARSCFTQRSMLDTVILTAPQAIDSAMYVSEILFYPKESTNDFVEFYNGNPFSILLNDFRLCQVNESNQIESVSTITSDRILIPPYAYFVVGEEPHLLLNEYKCGKHRHLIHSNFMPTLSSDEGTIGICTSGLQLIDAAHYSEDQHHSHLIHPRGVSLERLQFQQPAQDPSNWHSTSYIQDFATPALPNSHHIDGSTNGEMHLSSRLLTPNNDGLDDLLSISFNLPDKGWICTLTVFDIYGREMCTLLDNRTIRSNDILTWNARCGYPLVKQGNYILLAELWNPNGKKLRLKDHVRVFYGQ